MTPMTESELAMGQAWRHCANGGFSGIVSFEVKASIPKQERKAGRDDGLIRLSVGIEHLPDLLEDLKRGLSRECGVRS